MLKTLDVLIGLAVVMLALSMAATMITQFVTATLNTRGRHLRRGLADLLTQLDPDLAGPARSIATTVLTHPLVSATSLFGKSRLGSVVHREELTKLLLQLADGSGTHRLESSARDALRRSLAQNGIADPAAALRNIRARALQLEADNPQLGTSTREATAVLREATSDYVGKLNAWFDQSIDRVAQRFTGSTRAITFMGALVVALALQVDTVVLVNRLSADDKVREALVQKAIAADDARRQQAAGAAPSEATGTGIRPGAEGVLELVNLGLISLPRNWDDWHRRWPGTNKTGILVTALLLSLGAPFWYNALRNFVQLRSVLAAKDDQQRAARGTDIAAGSPTGTAPAGLTRLVTGERGDPVAVG